MGKFTQWACGELTTSLWNGWDISWWTNAKKCSFSVHGLVHIGYDVKWRHFSAIGRRKVGAPMPKSVL